MLICGSCGLYFGLRCISSRFPLCQASLGAETSTSIQRFKNWLCWLIKKLLKTKSYPQLFLFSFFFLWVLYGLENDFHFYFQQLVSNWGSKFEPVGVASLNLFVDNFIIPKEASLNLLSICLGKYFLLYNIG